MLSSFVDRVGPKTSISLALSRMRISMKSMLFELSVVLLFLTQSGSRSSYLTILDYSRYVGSLSNFENLCTVSVSPKRLDRILLESHFRFGFDMFFDDKLPFSEIQSASSAYSHVHRGGIRSWVEGSGC